MRLPFHRLAATIAIVVRPAFLNKLSMLVMLVVLVVLVMLVMPTGLRADGPADNLPATVRPIPPVGIELDDATRTRLQDAVVALTRDVDAATDASDADRAEVLVSPAPCNSPSRTVFSTTRGKSSRLSGCSTPHADGSACSHRAAGGR